MKSLDEVIKARKICDALDTECEESGCPYLREIEYKDGQSTYEAVSCLRDMNDDTLHYLQKYQKCCQEMLDAEMEDYRALTWEELKEMKGKPVWIEGRTMEEDYKYWCIVEETDVLDTYIHLREHGYNNWKETYGDWWNAYRKER